MTVIKFSDPGNNKTTVGSKSQTIPPKDDELYRKYHTNPDTNPNNQMDLYSQLSNWHESDNITMIIGGNTYTASKQQMMSVLSYYVGMMNMRNMCNLNMNLNFGETPNTPNGPNTPNRSNRNIKK